MIITDNKIRDENLQYGINRETVNVSALSSEKIYKNQYLTVNKDFRKTCKTTWKWLEKPS